MAFTFQTAEEDGAIVARIGGARPSLDTDTVEQLWGYFDGVAALCRQREIRRLLVLSSASGKASSSAVLSFYARLEDFGFDRSLRIALVVVDEAARRITELGVAVAESRGWPIKAFGTAELARRWLDSPPTPADDETSGSVPQ